MYKICRSLLVFLPLAISASPGWASERGTRVEVYAAQAADVNSFVFFDSAGSLIVDATRSSADARKVAKLARKQGSIPAILFITHGHPDHYLGMGALKKEFPKIRILVANQQVKDDIIRFAETAEKNQWLSDEPGMRPKSSKHPDGFDYPGEIQLLAGKILELPAGDRLDVLSDYPATEAAHETLLYSKVLQSLFASDLVYNGVHLWLGRGVDEQAIKNWRVELKRLGSRYSKLGTRIYPGHGTTTDAGVFGADLEYLDDFESAMKSSKTQEEVRAAMIKKYPTCKNADFILAQSVKTQFESLR